MKNYVLNKGTYMYINTSYNILMFTSTTHLSLNSTIQTYYSPYYSNTLLHYRLNPLLVGTGCVLKSNTRLLSGASMDAHSIMLEHTLVMAGEVVDCGSVWQGWPSSSRTTLEKYRAQVRLCRIVWFWT